MDDFQEREQRLVQIITATPGVFDHLEDLLRDAGLEWYISPTGASALEQLNQILPDVILAAVTLPDMSGIDICRQIKANHHTREIPVLFLDETSTPDTARTVLAAGANDYLAQPVPSEVIVARIQAHLTMRKLQQDAWEQERRLHEELLERQRTQVQLVQLRKAVDTMPLGVTVTDLGGIILYVNAAEADMHGYQVEELLGQHVTMFSPPEYHRPRNLQQIRGWKGLARESVNLHKNGRRFPVWLMSEIVQNAAGEPSAIVTSCEDITERKALEAEREQHRSQLETLVMERTIELSETNVQLRQEVLKHQHTAELLQQRNRELALLNHVSELFSSSIELDEVLEIVLHEVHRLMNIEATSFWMRTPNTEELICRQATGPGRDTVIGWRLTYGQGTVGQAAQTGEPVLIDDTRASPAHYKGVDEKTGIELRSILSLPVRVKGAIIGVLSLVDTQPQRFTENEQQLIEPIAAAAASAVENARLYLQASQEIAERTLAEKALKELEYIVNHSPVIVFLWRADEHWSVEFVSENIQQFGYAPNDFYAQNLRFTDLIYPEDLAWVGAEVLRYSQEPDRIEFQQAYRLLSRTGEVRWVENLTWMRRNSAGRITHYQGIIMDITDRKQAEEALRQAKEDAENANRAKSEFLANMSHEIRTPLNAVLGFTDLLAEQIADPLQKSYLEAIKAGGKNLLMLINDILDLSKIEAGKLEIRPKPVSLKAIFQELRQIFHVKLTEKQLAWMVEIAPDVPDYVLLDEIRIRQILFNLIGNAIKFTDQGYVKVTAASQPGAEPSPLTGKAHAPINLRLTVEDSGLGIPDHQHALIFEAFRQQDGQDTRKYGGTGLGLTITKRLMEMMNGTISLESSVGAGSRFILCFPGIVRTSGLRLPSEEPQEYQPAPQFAQGVVLIVDDIAYNRVLIQEYLRHSNLTVIEAENGEQAVRLTEQYQPDVILMDLRMPVMDGYQALKYLKRQPATQHIPVVALTATTMTQDEERIKAYGFDGYLRKPATRQEILHMIARVVPALIAQPDLTDSEASPVLMAAAPPADWSALLDQLHQQLPAWQTAARSGSFEAIEEFGAIVWRLGEQYHCEQLIKFSEKLLASVEQFDVESLQHTLNLYPQLIATIQEAQQTS